MDLKKNDDKMKTHKDLDVWKKAVDFVTDLYKETQNFPKEELYGTFTVYVKKKNLQWCIHTHQKLVL